MNNDDLNIVFNNEDKLQQSYKLQYFWDFL